MQERVEDAFLLQNALRAPTTALISAHLPVYPSTSTATQPTTTEPQSTRYDHRVLPLFGGVVKILCLRDQTFTSDTAPC